MFLLKLVSGPTNTVIFKFKFKRRYLFTFRKETLLPLCFTLDAGANVHLLYPNSFRTEIHSFIEGELSGFCQKGQYLFDAVGKGAKKV